MNLNNNKKNVYILDLIIKNCVLILSAVLPIFFVNNITLQGIVFQKFYFFYIIMFVIIVIFLIKSFFVGAVELRKHRLDLFVLLFVFISLIGTFFSIDKYHSILGFLDMPSQGLLSIVLLAILYFIINTYINKNFLKKILFANIFSAIIVLVWSAIILLGILPDEIFKTFPANLIGSFSSFSAYLLINIPLFIIAFSYSETFSSKIKKIIGVIGFGLVTIIIPIFLYIFLYNYTKWSILLVGLVLFLLLMVAKVISVTRRTFFLTVIIFIFTIIFLLIGEPKNEKVNLPIEVSLSYSQSVELIKNSFFDNLLFGTGFGTFKQNFLLHKSNEMILSYNPELKLSSPSGAIFGILTTQGLLGSVVFALLIIVGLYLGLKSVLQKKIENNIIVAGFGISAFMFLLYSLFTRIDSDLALMGIFVVIVYFSYINNIVNQNKNVYKLTFVKSEKVLFPLIFAGLCVLVGVAYVIVIFVNLFLADMNMKSFMKDSKNKNFYGMEYNANKIKKRTINDGQHAIIIARHFLNFADFLSTQSEDKRDLVSIKKSIEYAVKFANHSVTKLPNSSLAWEIRGLVYENSGGMYEDALQKSRESYENALKYDPKNVNYIISLTRLKLIESNIKSDDSSDIKQKKTQVIKEAKVLINKAIEIKRNYGPSYSYLSVIELALGDIDNSIIAEEKALLSLKNNANYMLQLSNLYQQRGEEKDLVMAVKLLQQILATNKNLDIQLSLALLLERIGNLNLASEEYQSIMDNMQNKDSKLAKTIEKFLENTKNGKSNIVKSDKILEEKDVIIDVKKNKDNIEQGEDDNSKIDNNKQENDIDTESEVSIDNKVRIKLLDGGGGKKNISKYNDIISTSEEVIISTGEANSKKYENITIYYSNDFEEYVSDLVNKINEINSDITLELNDRVSKQKNADAVVVIGTES